MQKKNGEMYAVYMHGLFNEIYDLSGFCIYRPLKDGVDGSQRDVVFLGWPKAPSYMSPNAGGGGAGSQPMSTAVHMEPK